VPATKKNATKSQKTKKTLPVKAVKKSAKGTAKSPARTGEKLVTIDRRRNPERRGGSNSPAPQRAPLERRAKVNRRRQIDPTTCERDYTLEEIEFMRALDDYKRANGRMFPTCSEVLEVIHTLGYEKRSTPAPVALGESAVVETPSPSAAV
jgi:hypothetical protein